MKNIQFTQHSSSYDEMTGEGFGCVFVFLMITKKICFMSGVTCKNLLAPDNGDIEYIVPEHERDDLSILQVPSLFFKSSCKINF